MTSNKTFKQYQPNRVRPKIQQKRIKIININLLTEFTEKLKYAYQINSVVMARP